MRQVVAVLASCVVLLLALRLVTMAHAPLAVRGLSSATPSPAEECAAFARFWMDTSDTGPDTVAAVSRCRQDASGAWILPDETSSRSASTAPLARTITWQLAGLETFLSPGLRRDVADAYDPVGQPVTSQAKTGKQFEATNHRYALLLRIYVHTPAHRELAAYLTWQTARRQAAVTAFRDGCANHPAMVVTCTSVAASIGAELAPWPWELRDEMLLGEYVDQTPHRHDLPRGGPK